VPVLSIEPIVMAYNSDLVKIPISSYPDILRPEFKGKIATIELVSDSTVAWYEWFEKTQGANNLAQFAAQKPRLFGSAITCVQAIPIRPTQRRSWRWEHRSKSSFQIRASEFDMLGRRWDGPSAPMPRSYSSII